MAAKSKEVLKLLDVFEDFNNFPDMNGSINKLIIMETSNSCVAAASNTV